MYIYDSDMIKNNIINLMRDKGINQTVLAESVGVDQSRASKCLKTSEKAMFTFEQIVSIANVLGVSLDDIVNKKDIDPQNEIPFLSLADFAQSFYDFYKKFSFYMTIRDMHFEEERDDGIWRCDDIGIMFDTKCMSGFLCEFTEVATAAESPRLRDLFAKLWINDYVEKYKNLDLDGRDIDLRMLKSKLNKEIVPAIPSNTSCEDVDITE